MSAGPVVCIVDDDESMRESLTGLLRSAGFDARPFGSAEDFLENGDPSVADCTVLDVTMPGMSGGDLQEHLREVGIESAIVFITGTADPSLHAHLLERGALACLVKPFRDDELVGAVTTAIRVRPARSTQEP